MQIACIDNPNIGGYFGSSAPLLNRWKNITHTEICLFNSVDYPVNVVYDAPYTTCNKTSNSVNRGYMKYVVFAMYLTYFRQSQKKYEINGNTFKKIDLINQFLNSDVEFSNSGVFQMGGKIGALLNTEINSGASFSEKRNLSAIKQNKQSESGVNTRKNDLFMDFPHNKIMTETVDLFKEEFLDMDSVIMEYNSCTYSFKLSTEDEIQFAKTIIEALYHGCVPTANQINS